MSKVNDKDFETIACEFFERLLSEEELNYYEDAIDLNMARAFHSHILADMEKPYQFSTPLFAWWDLTSACNFRCIHCLYNDTEYSCQNELSKEEALNVVEQLANDFQIVQIALTGGEIFMRKDIIDIVRKLKENHIAVKLLTNGALITDEQIKQLSMILNPYTDAIQISLDGATKETFAKIRRTDLFDVIIENIKKLIKNNIKVDIATVVNNINYYEIEDIYKLCIKLGVNKFFATKMICYNDSHKALTVTPKELFKLSNRLLDLNCADTPLNANFYSVPEMLAIPEVAKALSEEKYRKIFKRPFVLKTRTCNMHDRISIRADGRVYMCMRAESCKTSLMGNCKEKSLMEIWETRHSNVFFQPRMLENMICKDCENNDICTSGCLVEAYENFGDINMPAINCGCKNVCN